MRVCHVWDVFPPLGMGGVERYILSFSNFLANEHPDLSFSLITDKTQCSYFKSRKIPKFEKINHLEVVRFGPNLLSVSRGLYYKLLKRNSKLLEQMMTSKLQLEMLNVKEVAQTDIFHVHGLWSLQYPSVGLWLSKRLRKPLVVSLHGDSVGAESFYSMNTESKEALEILTHACAITTYSPKVYHALENLGLGDKTHLIPNFVNIKDFKRPLVQNKGVGLGVVMVGRLDPFKDPLTAIQAFAYVIKKIPQATLEIIGDGPLYEPIKKAIHELGLSGSIFLLGKQTDVRSFLWKNDVLLTGNAYLSVIEAWSAGLAVVAADEETTSKLIINGKNGVLVEPKNPEKLADALLQTLNDRDFRDSLVSHGFESVRNYDIGSVSGEILGIYRLALKENQAF
jgi:L-malate glycosyltransferase